MKKLLSILALSGLVAGVTPSANGFLLSNGNFESGDFTSWTVLPAEVGPAFGVVNWQAQSGLYSVAFGTEDGGTDSLAQSFSTIASMNYDISFWVKAGGQPNFTALWNGAPLISLGATDVLPNWTQFNFSRLATGPVSTLSFAGGNIGDWIYLDNVTVVPEPGTLSFITLGLGCLMFRKMC